MNRSCLALVLVVILWIPAVSTGGDGGPDWKGELQSFLERTADALKVPGAAVIVATPEGKVTILTHGVQCAAGEDPVTPQTSFGIASLTKAFTATAAAVLVGEGAVEWDTTARELIPELELRDPVATELVTLRDLLANRSGLADHYLVQANISAPQSWILPRLALVEPAVEFRDRFFYSSLGYTLAGEMIGRAAGSTWGDVVSERLLEPLGMTSTAIGRPRETTPAACGHHRWRGSVIGLEPLALGVGSPGNGLYSTAEDMARWLELLLKRGEFDGRRIVDAGAMRETWTPQVAIRRPGPELLVYGLGWNISQWRGRRIVFHNGGGAGFTSQVRVYPEAGIAVAVLANRAVGGLPDTVAERASALILGEAVREDLLDVAVRMTERLEELHEAPAAALRQTANPEAPPSLEVSAYRGCYENPAFGRFEVWTEGDGVTASFHDMDVAVEHLHDDVFLLSSAYMGDLAATFTVSNGTVSSVSMLLGSPEGERVFTRRTGSCAKGSAGAGS